MSEPVAKSELAARYRDLLSRISAAARAAGRAPEKITLLAVSKTQPIEAIEELYHLGHRDFGENYAQELVAKAEALAQRGCTGIRWHMIGHLQTNKAKALVPWVHAVHSIDSEKLARELAKRWAGRTEAASAAAARLAVYLEVNIDAEPTKAGLSPEQALTLAPAVAALPELSLHGFMAIPAPGAEAAAFVRLRELELRCRPHTQGGLSMGMSADFEAAIATGSTCVRVGRQLFKVRSPDG